MRGVIRMRHAWAMSSDFLGHVYVDEIGRGYAVERLS
jgi:hypothetical protein